MITPLAISKVRLDGAPLTNATLRFDWGTVIGLAGDASSGVDCLTRILTGNLSPDHGLVVIDGKPRTRKDLWERSAFIDARDVLPTRLNRRGNLVGEMMTAIKSVTGNLPAHAILVASNLGARLTLEEDREVRAFICRTAGSRRLVLFHEDTAFRLAPFCAEIILFANGRMIRRADPKEFPVEALERLRLGDRGLLQIGTRLKPQPSPYGALATASGLAIREGVSDLAFAVQGGTMLGITGFPGEGIFSFRDTLFGREPNTIAAGCLTIGSINFTQGATIAIPPETACPVSQEPFAASSLLPQTVGEYLLGKGPEIFNREDPFLRNPLPKLPYKLTRNDPSEPLTHLAPADRVRLRILRAMLHGIPLLLVDSPTRGLTSTHVEYIHAMLRGFVAAGGAAIIVSENISELFQLCQKVGLIFEGRWRGAIDTRESDPNAIETLYPQTTAQPA